MRIVILGYVVRGPLGGLAWHHLQYVRGLADLGHEVLFVEDSDDYPACYDPVGDTMTEDPSYGLAFAASAFDRLGLGDSWAYYDAHRQSWAGGAGARARAWCERADVLLDVSGVNPIRSWLCSIPVRALIDTDPVFTQVKAMSDRDTGKRVRDHNVFFTFAENVDRADASLPDDGRRWHPTRQPVVLSAWPVAPGPKHGAFTTVMAWESYPPVAYRGRTFGTKAQSFAPFLDLPAQTPSRLELAIGSPHAPRDELREHGWTLVDPRGPTLDPWTYQQYIQDSRGEFSVAKEAYVSSRSGWFSERTTSYLASGRPCVVQDTGFSDWLPTGDGLVAFTDLDEAVEGLADVERRYEQHCVAARELVADAFESGRVLTSLLDVALGSV
ncbi:MAG: hypothetical protein QOH79_3348 [Acidimicrobiaceae bacterium]